MKLSVIIILLLLSSVAFAGTRKPESARSKVSNANRQVTIDLDKLSEVTRNVSLLQPVLTVVKWMTRPEPMQPVRKEKSFFI